MNENNPKERMAQAIGGMLMAFPSSASNIRNEGVVHMYLMAVEGLNADAVVMACKAFVRGEVEDYNTDFAPSAPRLAKEAKAVDERMSRDEFWAKTEFVEFDTPEWRAICKQRGGSMPEVERSGKRGWYVPKDEVAAIPDRLIAQERALLEKLDGQSFAIPKMERIGK